MKRLAQKIRHAVVQRPRLHTALFVLALIVIAVISHAQWFNPSSTLTYGDWQYRPDAHVRQLVHSWQTWVPFEGMGAVNILMSGFPFRGLAWSAITNLGFSYDVATKLTMFIPVALFGFLGAFALGMRLFKDRLVAFVAALSYGSTPYFLLVQSVHGPIAVVYSFLPLLVLVLDNAIERNRLRDWLILALGFCVGIFYEVRIMYIVTFILAVYFIGTLIIRKKQLLRYMAHIGIAMLLIVTINLFWLIPTKLAAGAGIGQTAEGRLFGNSLFDLAQSFTIMRWNWTGGAMDRTFAAQPVPPYLWIVPIVAFLSVLAARHVRKLLIFVCIALVGIFLTKQSAEPLTGAYTWLFTHFPGFGLFREASKFYVLVAFGYFGMIGYALLGIRQRYRHTNLRYVYGFIIGALMIASAITLWPAVTQQLAGTFKDKPVPADYQKFASFVQSQPEFFRTYWLPRESWWGYYDNTHPRVRAADMLERDWQPFTDAKGGNIYEVARKNAEFLKQPYTESLLGESSIKYVVVPIRDTASDDDFFPSYGNDRQYFINQLDTVPYLKRIDIGAKELAVYENTSFKPYISTADDVYAVADTAQPAEQASFISGIASHYVTAGVPAAQQDVPLGAVDTLFALQGHSNASDQDLLSHAKPLTTGSYIQVGQKAQRYHYTIEGGVVTLVRAASGSLYYDGQLIDIGQESAVMASQNLLGVVAKPYYLAVGDSVVPLGMGDGAHEIGSTTQQVRIVQSQGQNSLKNASFEEGAWGPLFDCNGALSRLVSMDIASGAPSDGKNILNLYAQRRQTACVSQQVPVTAGDYVLQFDYQNQGGEQVGVMVTFNDSRRTVVEKQLSVVDGQWRQFIGLVPAPEGATQATITLKGYAGSGQDEGAVSSFDNAVFALTAPVVHADAVADEKQKIPVSGTGTFTFADPAVSVANAMSNPSFEDGPWQSKIGDCHNYDSRPNISMGITNDASAGTRALRLEATRHIACTHQSDVPVFSNTPYVFGFAYRAQNTERVHYRLVFDDPAKTVIDKYLVVSRQGAWEHFTSAIHAPLGAQTVTVRVEAIPNAYGRQHVVVDFDDFSLKQSPPVLGAYHTVTPPTKHLTKPRQISFTITSPTRKDVVITGASTPFYLMMHEKYDPYWRFTVAGKDVKDARHFQVTGSLNAWYIDPATLCSKPSARCTKNADGTYTIRASIAFAPQRVFSAELVVSGIAFAGALGYIVVDWYQSNKRKRHARTLSFTRTK